MDVFDAGLTQRGKALLDQQLHVWIGFCPFGLSWSRSLEHRLLRLGRYKSRSGDSCRRSFTIWMAYWAFGRCCCRLTNLKSWGSTCDGRLPHEGFIGTSLVESAKTSTVPAATRDVRRTASRHAVIIFSRSPLVRLVFSAHHPWSRLRIHGERLGRLR